MPMLAGVLPVPAIRNQPHEAVTAMRALKAEVSEPSDAEPSVSEVAKKLAEETVACFTEGQIFCTDTHVHKSAHAKVKAYCAYVNKKFDEYKAGGAISGESLKDAETFLGGLPRTLTRFPTYVAKALLGCPAAFEHLAEFAPLLTGFSPHLEPLVTKTGKAIAILAKAPVDSDEDLQFDFMELSESENFKG